MEVLRELGGMLLGVLQFFGALLLIIAVIVALMFAWQFRWWVVAGIVVLSIAVSLFSDRHGDALADRALGGFKVGLLLAGIFWLAGGLVEGSKSMGPQDADPICEVGGRC